MTHNTPLSPRPLHDLADVRRRVVRTAQLRAQGLTPADITTRCRPGGPWQQLLPGVHLLHPGPPTSEERLHAVLLYAAREATPGVPAQPGPSHPGPSHSGPSHSGPSHPGASNAPRHVYADAVITGLAALTLHGFTATPPLPSLDHIDVLVPRLRRLRTTGCARVIRTAALPAPETVTGLPVAPVPRALADAVADLADADAVRHLLTEAVRAGHCDPASVVRELTRAKLLNRPHVVDAVDSLIAEGRSLAEDRLYAMVSAYGLPDPVWNVGLRLPGGPHLGGLDAYWPDQAVAIELDTRAPRQTEDTQWSEYARKREHLERLGITVVHITPRKLRDAMEQQAAIVRTALMASADRDPAAYVVVLPR
ncbi:hypothetical protein [Streptomyces sp. NPDC006997]|uniref:hypothetical protein n=1 Tax=Streptomyces sp. NPDC006997 TaxID=3155356 RepID=UPI0033F89E8B